MKEIFLQYAKKGAMTKEELAAVLKVTPRQIEEMVRRGKIPRLPHMRLYRFDPVKMIEVFCDTPKPQEARVRSLTIEGHKTGAKPTGGYRKCL